MPFFYVHSWWLNDDLAWDSIFSKTPNKPSLVQETGIMHIEAPDGRSKLLLRLNAPSLPEAYLASTKIQ
ncbi:MAG: hypothetical protein RL571_2908 [Pseudomonadota bacterium]